MKTVITGKIDVTKINKQRLYAGKKGKYLSIAIFLTEEDDQYGNRGMIVESVSKEERMEGTQGAILGNVRVFTPRVAEPQAGQDAGYGADGADELDDEDIPF